MNRSRSAGSNGGSVNGADVTRPTTFPNVARAFLPHFVSKLKAVNPKPLAPTVALLSPCVSAPSDSNLRATAEANRFSPPTEEMRNLYSGAEDWFDRCVRPSCWMALSADQGNSSVMWTRRRWFATLLSACNEIPADAASEIIATCFSPPLKACFSCMFCISKETPLEFRAS